MSCVNNFKTVRHYHLIHQNILRVCKIVVMNDHVDDYTSNTMERYQEKGMVKGTDDVKGYGVEKGTLSALWSKKTVEKRIVIDVTEEDERKGRVDRDHADDVEVDGSGEKVDGAHPHGGGAEEKDTGEGQRPQEDGFQIRMCSGFAVMDVDGVNDGDGQVKVRRMMEYFLTRCYLKGCQCSMR